MLSVARGILEQSEVRGVNDGNATFLLYKLFKYMNYDQSSVFGELNITLNPTPAKALC